MAALVKQHKENEKEREMKKADAKGAGNVEVAHPAPTPALKQRQKQAQADATRRQLETTPAAVSNGLVATGPQTTRVKKTRTDHVGKMPTRTPRHAECQSRSWHPYKGIFDRLFDL